jgi:WD40 repeat protein
VLILSGHHGKVHTLAFSPDGLTLASVAGRGHEIWLWDLLSGMVKAKAPHGRRIVSLAFSPRPEPMLACADSAGQISLWYRTTGEETRFASVNPFANHPVQVVFSPEGNLLAAGSYCSDLHGNSQIITWDCGSGVCEKFHCFRRALLTSIAFAPDNRALISGGVDGWCHLWEEGGSKEVPSRLQHGQTIHFVAYAPDGSTFVTAGQRGLIKAWDARTCQKRTTLKGQGKHLHGIAYSPDSATLATASGDGKVRFWDVASGRLRRAFDWGVGQIHSIAFAPDGLRAAAGGDNDILIWDIDEW